MMDTPLFASEPDHEWASHRPPLPLPKLARWQPLRLGLVELYHYDSEEFWFRDGHLLLRGNNGTGKSKVLSLTLPFLLDAQVKPSRIEPDGDAGKKMAWNLLMGTISRSGPASLLRRASRRWTAGTLSSKRPRMLRASTTTCG